jgi:hypothetical protein
MVLWLRVAAAGLLLIGVVSLAAPVPLLGLDCGSPFAPRQVSAADAWNDAYEFRDVLEDCPGHRRARIVLAGAAGLGAVAAVGLPALVARRRSSASSDEA